jgi:hypothetical protein
MRRYFVLALLALGACVSDAEIQAASKVYHKATDACGKQLVNPEVDPHRQLHFMQCNDKAFLAEKAATFPLDMDLYQEQAARNELAAAQQDAGKLTSDEVIATINANYAEMERKRKDREIARKAANHQITCSTIGDETTCN